MNGRVDARSGSVALSTRAAAADCPHGIALVAEGAVLSWAELAQRVAAAAGELLERGALEDTGPTADRLAEAPRVAVVGERRLDTIVTVLALVELGVPFALLHPRWTAAERRRIVDALRPRLVVDETWKAPAAAGAQNQPAFDTPRPRLHRAADEVADEVPLAVLFTSGTSGTPKGAVLSRRAFLASARASEQVLGWRDDDRWLLSLPLAHVGGLSIVMRCLAARRTVVLDPSPSFAPEAFAATVERHGATIVSLVPTMLHRLLAADVAPPASLRVVLLGGARASEPLQISARDAGWPILATYGLTEACSQVATQRPGAGGRGPSRDSGCGPPLPGVELRIVAEPEHGEAAAPGEAGEIFVRGAVLFSGYLRLDSGGAGLEPLAIGPDAWFRTGDAGRIDARGCLHVLDRRTDLVITGGENVYPSEVEQVLERCPGVGAACVFGVDDEEWGQVVAVMLVASEGAVPENLLREHLAELSPFKRPRIVRFVDELPVLANGKVDRQACRASVLAERTSRDDRTSGM